MTRKEIRDAWKSTNIFMRLTDRLETNRMPETDEVAIMQEAHKKMRENYDNIEYFTGGDQCQE